MVKRARPRVQVNRCAFVAFYAIVLAIDKRPALSWRGQKICVLIASYA